MPGKQPFANLLFYGTFQGGCPPEVKKVNFCLMCIPIVHASRFPETATAATRSFYLGSACRRPSMATLAAAFGDPAEQADARRSDSCFLTGRGEAVPGSAGPTGSKSRKRERERGGSLLLKKSSRSPS